MKTLGLTGGMGMGKSTAASLLSELNVPVIDTDIVAREVVEPGRPALAEIQAAFGPDVIGPDGRLRREELARRVFPEPAARSRLESILHPRIRTVWKDQVECWRRERRPASVIVIPLLFEVGSAGEFDRVVCVACSEATQLERLRARGWSDDEIRQRIQAQWPVSEKMALADFVVWTEGDLSVHREQLHRILVSFAQETTRNG